MCHDLGMNGEGKNLNELEVVVTDESIRKTVDDHTVSESLPDVTELYEKDINKVSRVLGETQNRHGIKDLLTLITATTVGMFVGGIGQIITEQPTAYVNGQVVEKFPEGMNLGEEFIEGGVAMSVGVILGELMYRAVIAKTGMRPDSGGRSMMWMFGSMTTYLGMFFAGDWLHQVLNIADVPTIEMLEKLIGG